jgi:serine/threonine protein kinase
MQQGSTIKPCLAAVHWPAARAALTAVRQAGPRSTPTRRRRRPGALQEAGLLWRLRHPNIVALSGVCISEGQGFLLMELMEGGSLHTHLNIRSKSTEQRVLAWHNRGKHVALDIAAGLHYLHRWAGGRAAGAQLKWSQIPQNL